MGVLQAARRKRINTASITRMKPVSLWSGFVKTDGRGRGAIQFRMPQFNGKLRLMAVAFAGADYGAAEAYLTVREPIVLTPTFPRFLAGGDKLRVPVNTFLTVQARMEKFIVKLQAVGRFCSCFPQVPLMASEMPSPPVGGISPIPTAFCWSRDRSTSLF